MRLAEDVAHDQDGVISRSRLRSLGVTREQVRIEVRAKRWRKHGRNAVAVHTVELSRRAQWRSAVFETGADAALDGVTALLAAGLEGYDERTVTVSVSQGKTYRRPPGVEVKETRLRRPGDVMGGAMPRVRPPIAAVRAALWAKSDRQAALINVMAVQQRLARAEAVERALRQVRRHARRRFLMTIVCDVVDGARALGELDFARMCRERGLPQPSRQVVRRGPCGRYYLDVYWEGRRLVVEIEGIHHGRGETQVADALRQNTLSLKRDTVLRIPLLGLRVAADEFMAQVATGLSMSEAA